MNRPCGVVLAGGRGERFGGAKAFAALPDGRTFLTACRDLLVAAGCEPVVATLPAAELRPPPAGVRAVVLPRPGLEMFDSLKAGLAEALADTGWTCAIVLPVDHPLVDAKAVRALAAGCTTAALPLHGGRHGHPVALARAVAVRIVSGELAGPTLREVLRAVGAADVPVDDAGVRANCNTPEALAAAWSALKGGA